MDKQRPVILIVAVVLGIILGALGVMGGCMGVFGAAVQGASMEIQEQLGQGDPRVEAQLAPQRAILEAQAAYQLPIMIGQFLNVIVSLALIAGAGMFAALKRSGATTLVIAAIACIFDDLFNGAFGIYMSYAMQGAMEAAMSEMANVPGQDPAVFAAVMQSSMTIGIVLAVGTLLVKLVVYAVEIWATRDAAVQRALT